MQSDAQNTYAYRIIVFQLKKNGTLADCLPAKKLLNYRSVIISEHPPSDDNECEWNGLHYHGIVEHEPKYRFDGDRVFNQFKAENCEWFKSEQCKLPANFIAYMQLPPRKIVYRNMRNDESDLLCLEASVTDELREEVKNRKSARIQVKKEGSQDIMKLKDWISQTGAQSESELLNYFHNDSDFEQIYCKRTFSMNFKKALNFSIQATLDTDIRDLCINYKDNKNLCMSPNESATVMENWLRFQNIDPQRFVDNMIALMNKKKRKLNTIILKGKPNSGKTFIAKSMEKAAIFYGEISQGIAGYSFMWQDCVNKRLIVINEPYFDMCMIEQLKVVLEGTGTFVHKKNSSDEYLRPTPVLITTNNDVWNFAISAKDAIKARCLAIYDNLKPCPMLKKVKRDLHPQWLSILRIKYAPNASPVSDFSDDECPTSQAIGIVDLVPTSKIPTPRADLLTSSTHAAENTIELSQPTPAKDKRKRTPNLLDAPLKKVRWETSSRQSSGQRLTSDTPSISGCQEQKKTQLRQSYLKTREDLRRQLDLNNLTSDEECQPTEIRLDQQEEQEEVWMLTNKQQVDRVREALEEEDKSPQ